jgi:hypothetical protein
MRPTALVLLVLACSSTSTRPAETHIPAAAGSALMVVGTIPLVGTDVVIRDALQARGLTVQEVQESAATVADAEGKQLVVLSFSMQSTSLKADFTDVHAPILVLEHFLLPRLGMTTNEGHGFQNKLTAITLNGDSALTAGLSGSVTVYQRVGEMFWGIPGPGAIKVATAEGHPERSFIFAYPPGAMMVSKPAPNKRVHFFFAVHAPPPVKDLYLNENGLKLLTAALDWSLSPPPAVSSAAPPAVR